MDSETKKIIYFKDKNDTIITRTTKAKKAKFKSIVPDMSASINEHIDQVIKKHGNNK